MVSLAILASPLTCPPCHPPALPSCTPQRCLQGWLSQTHPGSCHHVTALLGTSRGSGSPQCPVSQFGFRLSLWTCLLPLYLSEPLLAAMPNHPPSRHTVFIQIAVFCIPSVLNLEGPALPASVCLPTPKSRLSASLLPESSSDCPKASGQPSLCSYSTLFTL